MRRELPTITRLREALDYDPETGIFRWKTPAKKAVCVSVGQEAGSPDSRYRYITVDLVRIAAHRAALAMTFGEWPVAAQIDHIDGNGLNNRLTNLRAVSASMNQQNQRRAQRTSSTGLLGVVPCLWRKSPRQFRAQIWINGAAKNLGYFLTAQDAHEAYVSVKRVVHSGCTL